MKERPVIFNGEMVRAILHGRKTQTRRVMKPQPVLEDAFVGGFTKPTWIYKDTAAPQGWLMHNMCPFGRVGDRLWVRETFAILGNEDGCPIDWDGNLIKGDEKHAARIYKASCWQEPGNYGLWSIPDRDTLYEGAWRPSIHMPRWASRITLEITAVRVERLNDISEEDAKAEGVAPSQHIITPPEALYRVGFLKLWQSIYGEESWSANPWVWVIEFRRVGGSDASK
ncbi:hypothetical protein FOT61_11395 [Serratia marcescens]|uniref:hypothetical protein n=1 Tax=Serratia marcescens TaxID=615 RepID=UPI0011CB73E5|nr:hypothetical protein [Serratia marcescens]TXE41391.1 hypothetical protein FOT61_11395 [Serratia marcescens]